MPIGLQGLLNAHLIIPVIKDKAATILEEPWLTCQVGGDLAIVRSVCELKKRQGWQTHLSLSSYKYLRYFYWGGNNKKEHEWCASNDRIGKMCNDQRGKIKSAKGYGGIFSPRVMILTWLKAVALSPILLFLLLQLTYAHPLPPTTFPHPPLPAIRQTKRAKRKHTPCKVCAHTHMQRQARSHISLPFYW